MNKFFRVIWSKVRNVYVVVPETARDSRKKKSARKRAKAAWLAALIAVSLGSGICAAAADMPGTYTYTKYNSALGYEVTYTCALVAQDGLTGYYRDSTSEAEDNTIYHIVTYEDDTYKTITKTNTSAVSVMPDTHTADDGGKYYLKNNTLSTGYYYTEDGTKYAVVYYNGINNFETIDDTKYGTLDDRGNAAIGTGASATGGTRNTAAGDHSSVTGGSDNVAQGKYSSVTGGDHNIAHGEGSSVTGGAGNLAAGKYATVSGGGGTKNVWDTERYDEDAVIGNIASGDYSSVSGGATNHAMGDWSSISGGGENYATGTYSSVAGGAGNKSTGTYSFTAGGFKNEATGEYSSIMGGYYNKADGLMGSTVGGYQNNAKGYAATVSGGSVNDATGMFAAVSGGACNNAAGMDSSVSGGSLNLAAGERSSILGGYYNTAGKKVTGTDDNGEEYERWEGGDYASISGGSYNTVYGRYSSILGGAANTADGEYSAIVGGSENKATGEYSVAVSGSHNEASGKYAAVSAGSYNTASDEYATVSAGSHNEATGKYATVSGGGGAKAYGGTGTSADDTFGNKASGDYATVSGGTGNQASGKASVVSGGAGNEASAAYTSISGGVSNSAIVTGASISGGAANTAGRISEVEDKDGNTETVYEGYYASISGGMRNSAYGTYSTVSGGSGNTASEDFASISGGVSNTAAAAGASILGGAGNIAGRSYEVEDEDGDTETVYEGYYSSVSGGMLNRAYGDFSVVNGGAYNFTFGEGTASLGGNNSVLYGEYSTGIAGGSTSKAAKNALAAGNQATVTVENGTAIGYQATTDEAGTIAFGHDAGDSYYELTWQTYEDPFTGEVEIDYFTDPTITEKKYDSASYNRLVKVGYGKDGHDAATMDQLTEVVAGENINVSVATDPVTGKKTYKVSNALKLDGGNVVQDVDTHIESGEKAVTAMKDKNGNDTQGVSFNIVNKEGETTGAVTITDVAKASDLGDVTKINEGLKNTEGNTTVVDVLNKIDNKVGDTNYSKVDVTDMTIHDGDNTTEAIAKLNKKLTETVIEAADPSSVSAGDNITVTPSEKESGGKDYKVSLNPDVTLGKKTEGDKTGADGSLTVISADGKNSVTLSGKDGTLKGLTNTEWKAENVNKEAKDGGYKGSTKAATESQLQQAMAGTVQYDRDEKGNVTNKVTLNKGGDAVTITNVAAGDISANSKDAVNGSQLYQTNVKINKLGDRIDRVGAGAAALAALHPLDFDPDAKWDFAAGYGNYAGANAAAIGAYYRPNEDLMFSVGGSLGGGENMVNAGVSVKLGSGSSHVNTSKVAMAKEIKELRGTVAEQSAQIAKLTELVNALVGAERALPYDKGSMFPDVPENHWAYEAVDDMIARGLIEGYPDGTFGGDRNLTRYEFAMIVHRALLRGAEVSEQLQQEFAGELKYFTVDTVKEDKEGNPTIQRVRTVKENLYK